MNEKTNESKFRSYFLGELTAQENERIESECFEDDNVFSLLAFAEEDLIKLYLGDELNASQTFNFEQNYLTTDTRRERVAVVKLLKAISRDRSNASTLSHEPKTLLAKPKSFFKIPIVPFGFMPHAFATMGLILLVLIIGILGLVTNFFHPSREMPETAQNDATRVSERPTSSSQISESKLVSKSELDSAKSTIQKDLPQTKFPNNDSQKRNRNSVSINSEKSTDNRPEKLYKSGNKVKSTTSKGYETRLGGTINTFSLFGGGLRDENSKEQIISLADSSPTTKFQLILPDAATSVKSNLRAELQNVEGAVIQVQTKLKVKSSKENKFVSVSFPTQLFEEKHYVLSLAEADNSSIADYTFRVEKGVDAKTK